MMERFNRKEMEWDCKNKKCARQFIGDHNLTYKGCHSCINQKIKLMLVRGVGIRDISEILIHDKK